MRIKGVGSVALPQGGVGRAGAGTPGFSVGGSGAAAGPASVPAPATVEGLLVLQETEGAPARDRRARQHGRAMLDALARLQLGLLGGEPDCGSLATLAALVEHCPEAADPGLQDVLAGVALRARVELARRGV